MRLQGLYRLDRKWRHRWFHVHQFVVLVPLNCLYMLITHSQIAMIATAPNVELRPRAFRYNHLMDTMGTRANATQDMKAVVERMIQPALVLLLIGFTFNFLLILFKIRYQRMHRGYLSTQLVLC